MLTHQIVTRVQNQIEDPDYWISTRLKAFINTAKDSIVGHFNIQATGMVEMSSVVAQQSYSLPHDFIALAYLYWGDQYYLYPKNKVNGPQDVYGPRTSDPDETGTPELYFLWGKEGREELWVWPTFDAIYTVQFWYWRLPPDVVNDNDEVLLPREWHPDIVEYCLRRTWVEDEEKGFTVGMFDDWWETRLMKMQISANIKNSAQGGIEYGDYNESMPVVEGLGFGFRINASDGAKDWGA
jgi:hypothetical protein